MKETPIRTPEEIQEEIRYLREQIAGLDNTIAGMQQTISDLEYEMRLRQPTTHQRTRIVVPNQTSIIEVN